MDWSHRGKSKTLQLHAGCDCAHRHVAQTVLLSRRASDAAGIFMVLHLDTLMPQGVAQQTEDDSQVCLLVTGRLRDSKRCGLL